MSAELDAFLEAALGEAFIWGASDCVLFPADWVLRRTGRDPAAAYRGRYRTAIGAERIIRVARGLEPLSAAGLAAAGWVASKSPRRGQVGLLAAVSETTHGVRPSLVGGICLGSGWWASRSACGVRMNQGQPLFCWRAR